MHMAAFQSACRSQGRGGRVLPMGITTGVIRPFHTTERSNTFIMVLTTCPPLPALPMASAALPVTTAVSQPTHRAAVHAPQRQGTLASVALERRPIDRKVAHKHRRRDRPAVAVGRARRVVGEGRSAGDGEELRLQAEHRAATPGLVGEQRHNEEAI